MRMTLALGFGLLAIAGDASARDGRLLGRRSVSGQACAVAQQVAPVVAATSGNQTAAGAAVIIASRGRVGHVGGNRGPEGVGLGSTQQQACQNACYWGKLPVSEIGYSQMRNGSWIAVVRYAVSGR